jgi:Peptidase family M28
MVIRGDRSLRTYHRLVKTTLGSILLISAASAAPPQHAAQADDVPDANTRAISRVPAVTELAWPLPASVPSSYDTIDGQRMKRYVEELAVISRRDRDRGTQHWGRIAGTPSGDETQQWVERRFREIGVPFEVKRYVMPTQDVQHSWNIEVNGGGNTVPIVTASPLINFSDYAPSAEGDLRLDTVWCGLGMPSDFIGRDVRGKAAFIYSIATPSSLVQSAQWMEAAGRAQKLGAKALVVVLAIPGNMRYVSHLYPHSSISSDIKLPIFMSGLDDGEKVEALNARLGGRGLTTHLRWKIDHIEGAKAAIVMGVLPGKTNESIVMIAHTDAFFEGAADDGAGTAALIETAAYYAKIPREHRRRTMYFVATPDHHGGDGGGAWLHRNFQATFGKTAVVMNAEHVATMEPVWDRRWGSPGRPSLIATNQLGSSWWGVYGSDRLAHIVADAYALFGVPTQVEPGGSSGELRQVQFDAPSFYLHNKGVYYHTDSDVPAVVPATGLRTAVQSFIKIFDDVNKLDLLELQAPASH